MFNKKESLKFYISVEGNVTEKLYFEHLKLLINSNQNSIYNLTLNCKKNKSPKNFIKNIPLVSACCFHIFDYESNSPQHQLIFTRALKEMKEINDTYEGKIVYKAGYSNLSFDLWILLHKVKFKTFLSYPNQYLQHINSAYKTDFESMDKYKKEENFRKQILSKISLDDVINAINFAKEIKEYNELSSKQSKENYGFKYYLDNPDLNIHKCIEEILISCGILKGDNK